jgi:hypothetical protein
MKQLMELLAIPLRPQSAGQAAGYSHLTKLQKPQQVIGYG